MASSKKSPTDSVNSVTPRKQLPSIPTNADSQQKVPPMSPVNTHIAKYGPYFIEYSILAEYTMLQKQRLPGVYVIPSAKCVLNWFGILFLRQGLYQGGTFQFNVIIPENYPDGECPRIVFNPPIFHPVVNPETGELDVKRAFPKWRRGVNHIWQLLLYARRIFYKIDTKVPSNPEAAVLYEQELNVFKVRVDAVIKTCHEKLYDTTESEDPHALRFSEMDDVLHKDIVKKIHNTQAHNEGDDSGHSTNGLTWMKSDQNGRPEPFSRVDSANA